MITKAIVKATPELDGNKYSVYIPLLRNANDSEIDATFEATLCFTNGLFYSLKVGDVVFVDFEDNLYDKPIILGKLFTNREDREKTSTQATLKTLKVTENAQFPETIQIGNTSISSVNAFMSETAKDISAIRDELNNLGSDSLETTADIKQAIKTLSSGVNSNASGISTLKNNIADLDSEVKNSKEELTSSISALNKNVNNSINSLSSRVDTSLSTLNSNITNVSNSISGLHSSISTLNSDVSTLSKNISTYSSGISTNKSNIDNLKKEFEDYKSSALSVITVLSNQVVSTTSSLSSMTTSINSIKDYTLSVGESVNKLSDQVSNHQTSITQIDNDVTKIKDSLKDKVSNDTFIGNIGNITESIGSIRDIVGTKLDTDIFTDFKNVDFTELGTKYVKIDSDLSVVKLDIGKKLGSEDFNNFLTGSFTPLTGRVSTAELSISSLSNGISGFSKDISDIRADLGKRLPTATFSTFLTGSWKNISDSITSHGSSITSILRDVTNINSTLTTKLDTTLFNTFKNDEFTPTLSIVNKVPVLTEKVAAAETSLNGLTTSVNILNTNIINKLDTNEFTTFIGSNGDFGKVKNNVSQLTVSVGSIASDLSSKASTSYVEEMKTSLTSYAHYI